jgi:malic enzyme
MSQKTYDATVDESELGQAALAYHRGPPPGKLAIVATKPMANHRELALAYSPGVAAACEEIARDPTEAFHLTGRGNLLAVISNGTAVLGLGAIGALASKPVMEGKAVLFKSLPISMCSISRSRSAIRTSWWKSSPVWKPPSAVSTWKISGRPSASRWNAS